MRKPSKVLLPKATRRQTSRGQRMWHSIRSNPDNYFVKLRGKEIPYNVPTYKRHSDGACGFYAT